MIKYFLENQDWELTRATEGASGFDLRAAVSTTRAIGVGERWIVHTGLFLDMPVGVEAQVRSRSGLAAHNGVFVLNAPGTIDADYRGEVKITLMNLGTVAFEIVPGERIAQLVFAPVFGRHPEDTADTMYARVAVQNMHRVKTRGELSTTTRGSSGHGSTGR